MILINDVVFDVLFLICGFDDVLEFVTFYAQKNCDGVDIA